MDLEGVVQGGVVVPEGECSLPEGTRVRIEEAVPKRVTLSQRLIALAKKCEQLPSDLPPDYSVNLDHYLHGMPKAQP